MSTMTVITGICRWTARVLSVGTLLFVLVFALGGPDRLRLDVLTAREWIMLLLFAAGIAGLLAGWRWELAGGVTALLALAAFELAMNHRMPGVWFFVLLGIPALLYLMARGLDRVTPAT